MKCYRLCKCKSCFIFRADNDTGHAAWGFVVVAEEDRSATLCVHSRSQGSRLAGQQLSEGFLSTECTV